jgi:hypothetical protein
VCPPGLFKVAFASGVAPCWASWLGSRDLNSPRARSPGHRRRPAAARPRHELPTAARSGTTHAPQGDAPEPASTAPLTTSAQPRIVRTTAGPDQTGCVATNAAPGTRLSHRWRTRRAGRPGASPRMPPPRRVVAGRGQAHDHASHQSIELAARSIHSTSTRTLRRLL